MKDRFSSLDIAVQVKELQSLIGSRLSNVYELGPRMFLFKIGAQMVIIESGVRIHTTTFSRAYSELGGFCTKLRKHLKNKRLNAIMQLGGDRRMALKFGDGEFQFYVVVEFYAQGNIILTDHTTKVLTFLRAHDGIQVGTKYDFPGEYIPYTITKDKIVDNFRQIINTWEGRKKKNLKIAMRSAFGKIYGPSLCDYALQIAGLNECEISRFVEESSDEFQRLLSALQECDELIKECINSPGGFIKFVAHEEYQEFVEFQPFKPLEGEILEYDSFNLAVDSYFTQLEIQKSQDKIRQAERQALKKLESVKLNAENQVKGYNISRKEKEMMAKCIEDNVDLVDACCKTVSTLVAGGMHWEDINDVIQDEINKGNQVAMAIKELALEKGKITLSLPLMSDGYDSEGSNHSKTSELTETLDVVVDIYQSAYSNARSLYSEKKIAAIKEVKSLNASTKALVAAERKIMEKLAKKTSDIPTISKTRVTGWYEQFQWFISTENCLVIGGRDPTQCDQLLMKYFKRSDILLNCDMEGSTLCIVKKSDGPIGNATLLQASTMVVCSSKAWDNKIVTSAYFLSFEQVTKVAHGEVLPPGKFEIKGVKNWLPPVQIQYGVGLLWCVDDETRKRHFEDRRPWKRGAVETFEIEKSDSIENEEKLNEPDSLHGAIVSAIISTPLVPEAPRFIEGVEHTENSIESTEVDTDLLRRSSGSTNDSPKNGGKLIVKQRKIQKKGERINEQSNHELYNDPILHKSKSNSPEIASKLPRGKRSKLKKIKEKYGYEDEGFQTRSDSTIDVQNGDRNKQKHEVSSPIANDVVPNPKKDPFKVLEDSKLFAVPEYELDNLVGLPLQEDILQACIPVCAPWLALQKFKYKIKIIPGSLKRGKACAQAKDAFLKMSLKFKSETEHELIGHVPAKDWNDAMVSKAKLVVSDKK